MRESKIQKSSIQRVGILKFRNRKSSSVIIKNNSDLSGQLIIVLHYLDDTSIKIE